MGLPQRQIRLLRRSDKFWIPVVSYTMPDLIDYLHENNRFVEARNQWIARRLALCLLLDAVDLPDEEHVRQHTGYGDCGHVDERRGEVDVGDEETDNDRSRDR